MTTIAKIVIIKFEPIKGDTWMIGAARTPENAAKPTPKPTKKAVTIVPKPSQSGTKVGVQNLKPGQKVKVTIKSGARP